MDKKKIKNYFAEKKRKEAEKAEKTKLLNGKNTTSQFLSLMVDTVEPEEVAKKGMGIICDIATDVVDTIDALKSKNKKPRIRR